MAAGTGRRHVMLLFAVLAGLFLMHGICTPSMHGMPMSASMPMASQTPVSSSMSVASPMPVGASDALSTLSDTEQTADHMQPGETCVPLRPEGMSGLFLALLLIVITLWRPRLPHAPRQVHPYWPHGPPRSGVHILRTLSISRT